MLMSKEAVWLSEHDIGRQGGVGVQCARAEDGDEALALRRKKRHGVPDGRIAGV